MIEKQGTPVKNKSVVRFLSLLREFSVYETVIETEDRCCSPLIFTARLVEWRVMRDSLVCIKGLQNRGYRRSDCVASNLAATNTHTRAHKNTNTHED